MTNIVNLKEINSISDDEKIARNILNICSTNLEITEDFLQFLDTVKSRHIILAKKIVSENSNVITDMVLFEYLIANINNADDFDDDEVFF